MKGKTFTPGVVFLVFCWTGSWSAALGQVEEAWVARYDGPSSPTGGSDEPEALVFDGQGNVYVTGVLGGRGGGDYGTVKYDGNGNKLWEARYDGPAGGFDFARALALDDLGNVYVTGQSWNPTEADYATVKYDTTGNELWVRRYDGPDNGRDFGHSLAVDSGGNVYVAGESQRDFLTVKYDEKGNELWVARYDGGERDSSPLLVVDGSGHVYVTGESGSAESVTLKYDTDGNELWAVPYEGGRTSALAVDGTGNLYVTGESDRDYVTEKYDGAGNEVWVARYEGPAGQRDSATALSIDDRGNVYVTGRSADGTDTGNFTTLKYNAEGEELWLMRYTAPNDGGGSALEIAVDNEGNVYVSGNITSFGTGWDYTTVKYDPAGKELWVARYDGPGGGLDSLAALTVDTVGNVFLTGRSRKAQSDDDYATVKYDTDGNELWVAREDGPLNSSDGAIALAVDEARYVYVTGTSDGHYATVKYGTDGSELWVKRYGEGNATASDLALERGSYLYVTGSSSGDYVTIKYDSAGNRLWVARYNGPHNGNDVATRLAIEPPGNVYVTGSSGGDYATVKYDRDGNELWVKRYDASGVGEDVATDLVVDGESNVYVTGSSGATGDYSTVKYGADGEEMWVACHEGDGADGLGSAIAVDKTGGVYIAGSSSGDYLTVKYDGDGNELWVAHYDSPLRLSEADRATAIAVDDAGHVYVTGRAGSTSHCVGCGTSYATVKYDGHGKELWAAQSGFIDLVAFASALTVDDVGGVYVTGTDRHDYVTVKYDSDGNEIWAARYARYHGPFFDHRDGAKAIAVDQSGGVYVTGASASEYATVKYIPTSAEEFFLRGDCNDDGQVDIADAILTLGSLFLGEGDPGCDDACDSNDDSAVDISDAIATLGVLFLRNGVIPHPGMTECGVDPTDDEVGCETFEQCP